MHGTEDPASDRHPEAGGILVFLGPTLPLSDAQAALDATFLRPAGQGDVLLAAHAFRPRAMVLIDGEFEHRPAVRHKEILWAMAQGIVMIGAASMGALRAAELHGFGMIGVGAIYRWYRRFPLAPDDAVAVQSGSSRTRLSAAHGCDDRPAGHVLQPHAPRADKPGPAARADRNCTEA